MLISNYIAGVCVLCCYYSNSCPDIISRAAVEKDWGIARAWSNESHDIS